MKREAHWWDVVIFCLTMPLWIIFAGAKVYAEMTGLEDEWEESPREKGKL